MLSTAIVAQVPTPLLNTPNFTHIFTHMPLDDSGLMRALEMVALPGTPFQVIKRVTPYIAQVETPTYPSKTPLYIDTRFTLPGLPSPPPNLPTTNEILNKLKSSLGLPYLWGGNTAAGIPKIRELYPTSTQLEEPLLTLKGLDCSGLLYEATQGHTPRNTSELFTYGTEVQSLEYVKPLDILVWPGHVIILLDSTTCIESLHGHGVIQTPLETRLDQLHQQKFSIRRWA